MPRRQIGLFVHAGGCTVIEYDHDASAIRVRGVSRIQRSLTSEAEVAAVCVEALGPQRPAAASVVVVVDGLGTVAHTMTLPPAADDVLRSVVEREVQRVYGVSEPAVAFVHGVAVERRQHPRGGDTPVPQVLPHQLVIVATTNALARALRSRLVEAGAELRLLTGVAHAVRRLYLAADGAGGVAAVLACPGGRVHLSFYLDGELAVALDPPVTDPASLPPLADVAREELRRGMLYVRANFHGAPVRRILLVSDAATYAVLAPALTAEFGVPVTPLAPSTGSAEEAVVIGAALEASRNEPLSVVPRPPTRLRRLLDALGLESAAVAAYAAAALLLAAIGLVDVGRVALAQRRTASLHTRVATELAQLGPSIAVARTRELVSLTTAAVRAADADRSAVATTLSRIAAAAPAAVQLDTLGMVRQGDGWRTVVTGRISAPTAAAAVRAVDEFYRGLPARLHIESPALNDLEFVSPTSAAGTQSGAHVVFRMTFIASPEAPSS